MSSIQRLAVWNGEREKTSGGLRKGDLIKNRHGRLVSKKKSEVARKLNNLGNYLAGAKGVKGNRKVGRKKDTKDAAAEAEEKVEKRKKKPAKRRRKPKGAVEKMVQDPEVKAKRKKLLKRKTQEVNTDVDVANIIPKTPKIEAKAVPRRTGRRRKKVDYSKMGGTLITAKQLQKAKKKPIPKRRKR